MNLRVKFNKINDAKYISHLDLLRTFNRMIMRSDLKPSYSQGYNPHIIMSFLQPSSVGMATKTDCVDLTVEGEYDLSKILENLKEVAPGGIEIISVVENTGKLKFNTLSSAVYSVLTDTNATKDDIISFLRLDEILIEKKTKKGIKEVDIKPLILGYEVKDGIELVLHLKAGSVENLNPSLLLKAMEKYIENIYIKNVRITREALLSENGEAF